MRRLASTWVAKALFVLLVLSFAVWGIEDVVRNFGRDTAVARVGDQRIEAEEAQMAARREMSRIARQMGNRFEPNDAIRRAVAVGALENLIGERAMVAEAQRMGVVAPEEMVRETVFAIPGLRTPDGRFSREILAQVLRSNELTEPQFLSLIRGDLLRQQLLGAVRAGAAAPDALTAPLLVWQTERRVADVVLLPFSAAPEPEAPTEAQLQRFLENNPQRFSTPEFRQISIAVLSAETLANEIAVSEEDIKQAFEARHGQYDRPERRQIRQVVLADEARAREIAQLWQAGAAWETVEAAATAAGGQAMALPMGDKASLPIPALADAAFAAPPQSVTDPVQSPFGWHVIGIEAVEAAQIFTLDQLRDQLRRDIAKDRALDLAYERGNKVEDALAGGMTLAEAAPRFGLLLVNATLDPGGRSPGNEAVALPVAADQRNAVLRAIFMQDQGAAPRLQEFGDAFAAIEVTGITPSQLRPFAEVEQDLRRAVIADARRRFTEARAAGLLAAQRGGKTLVEAAQEMGLVSTRTAPFGRDPTQGSPVPPELLPPLFEAKRGEATMAEIRGGFAVASVADILRIDPATDPLGMGRVRVEIEQAVGDDLEQQFQAALRVRANVRINERVLEQVIGR
ncbi:MAG: SurA N-terminal domain-containing protein [Roseomonas sp.]|nr:SurA N-terminal domain-containing protein [Roseomonas sp.]MCA3305347.1 SurA N-terminal domain-containing protein [Roseomonas sp.]